MVLPIIAGHGKRLFTADVAATLDVVNTMTTSKGVTVTTYRPVAEAPPTAPHEG